MIRWLSLRACRADLQVRLAASALLIFVLGATLDAQDPAPRTPARIEAAIKREPGNAKLYVELGLAFLQRNDFPRALTAFQQALQTAGVEFVEPVLKGRTGASDQTGQIIERVPSRGRPQREAQPFPIACIRGCVHPSKQFSPLRGVHDQFGSSAAHCVASSHDSQNKTTSYLPLDTKT